MSTNLKNVAIVGASGNLGPSIVDALLSRNFNVTVLTRASSSSKFPAGVTVKKINDFSSSSDLTQALIGQDAVVSTIATGAIGSQNLLVDAAVAAGVKRFIPSEFGLNTRTVSGTGIGVLIAGKKKLVDYLIEKAAENNFFSWTGIATGSFFDWGLHVGVYKFDKTTKHATIYDSGNAPVQASTLAFIGKSVAAVLSRPEETKNRYLTVAGNNISQNDILEIAEQETGAKWVVEHVKTADAAKAGSAALEKGQYGEAFLPLLLSYMLDDAVDHSLKPEDSSNKLLGLEDEDLSIPLKAWLGGI